MAKKDAFKFVPDFWLANNGLRICSAPARALWIDMLAIMSQSGGRMQCAGRSLTPAQIAALTGFTVPVVVKLLQELTEAGICDHDDGGIYASRMVRERGFAIRTTCAKRDPFKIENMPVNAPPLETVVPRPRRKMSPVPSARTNPSKNWWDSAPGWAAKGAAQAISPAAGESLEDFRYRVCERLGDGEWKEALTPAQLKRFEAKIAREKEQMEKLGKN